MSIIMPKNQIIAEYAEHARQLGIKNHNHEITAALVKQEINSM